MPCVYLEEVAVVVGAWAASGDPQAAGQCRRDPDHPRSSAGGLEVRWPPGGDLAAQVPGVGSRPWLARPAHFGLALAGAQRAAVLRDVRQADLSGPLRGPRIEPLEEAEAGWGGRRVGLRLVRGADEALSVPASHLQRARPSRSGPFLIHREVSRLSHRRGLMCSQIIHGLRLGGIVTSPSGRTPTGARQGSGRGGGRRTRCGAGGRRRRVRTRSGGAAIPARPRSEGSCGADQGRVDQRLQQLAHEVTAAVMEAGDLAGIIHGVLRRVLGQTGRDPGARHRPTLPNFATGHPPSRLRDGTATWPPHPRLKRRTVRRSSSAAG